MYIRNIHKLMIFVFMPKSPSQHLVLDEVVGIYENLPALLVILLYCSKQVHHLMEVVDALISISSKRPRSNSRYSNKFLSLNTFRPTQPSRRTTSTFVITVGHER